MRVLGLGVALEFERGFRVSQKPNKGEYDISQSPTVVISPMQQRRLLAIEEMIVFTLLGTVWVRLRVQG